MNTISYWDTSLGQGTGGGVTQKLQIEGQTLSLIPNGNSVELPVAYLSSANSLLQVSTLVAHDHIYVLNAGTPAITLTSTGSLYCSNAFGNLANFYNVTGNTTTTANLTATTGSITTGSINTLQSSNATLTNANVTTFNVNNEYVWNSAINTLSVGSNKLIIKDQGGTTAISQQNNDLTFNTPVNMAPSCDLSTQNIDVTGEISLNSNVISTDGSNLLNYNNQIIYAGQRGDASQWYRYPPQHGVNMNQNAIGGINNLTVDQGNVNILNGYIGGNSIAPSVTIGASFIKESGATQPDVNINSKDINITAGAALFPYYAAGRTINMDAYPGNNVLSQSRNSKINITAHGNTTIPLNPLAAPAGGDITLTAYAALTPFSGLNPFGSPGSITLNASQVNIGNNNTTPFGGTAKVSIQAFSLDFITGSVVIPASIFGPSCTFRAGGGIELLTDITNSFANSDSVIRVKNIIAQNNDDNHPLMPEPFGAYLTLDGREGGITLNNFKIANGQGAGATLNNILSMTGTYPLIVENQIKANVNLINSVNTSLQSQINAIVSNGGSNLSNIAAWYEFPALSTTSFFQDIALTKSQASISTVGGLSITDFAGNLAPINTSAVQIGSNSIFYTNDNNGYSFTAGTNTVNAPITVASIIFNPLGTSYTLGPVGNALYFNGQKIATNVVPISNISTFSNVNINSINADQPLSSITCYSALTSLSSITTTSLSLSNSPNYVKIETDSNGSTAFKLFQNDSNVMNPLYFGWDGSTYQTALSNVSSINGMPYGGSGGSGVSNIANWSYFPVTNTGISFGSQQIVLSGETQCSFSNQLGTETLPIQAKQFNVYDPNIGNIVSFGQNDSGLATIYSTGSNVTGLQVSTISFLSNVLSSDSSNIYVNNYNPVGGWASFTANSQIQAPFGLFMSNSEANATMSLLNGIPTFNSSSQFDFKGNFINAYGGVKVPGSTSLLDSYSVCAYSTITSAINIDGTSMTGSNGNLLVNGVVVNTSNSITNWASYNATSIVQSPYGYSAYSNVSQAFEILSGSNASGLMVLGLTSDGNGIIGSGFKQLEIQASQINFTNPIIVDTGSWINSNTVNTSTINTSNMNLSNLAITAGASNLLVNGSPLAYQVSYPIVSLGTYANYNYQNAGVYVTPTGFASFIPQYNFGILSVNMSFPATFVQNNSNYFIYGLARTTKIINTNATLPVINGANTYNASYNLLCDFTDSVGSSSNHNFKFMANTNDIFGFFNCQVKYLPN